MDLNPTKQYKYMDAGPARTGFKSILDWVSIRIGADNLPVSPLTNLNSTMTHHDINYLMVIGTMQLCICTGRDSSFIILYLENYSELQL